MVTIAENGPTELATSFAPWEKESKQAVKTCNGLNANSVFSSKISALAWIAATISSSAANCSLSWFKEIAK